MLCEQKIKWFPFVGFIFAWQHVQMCVLFLREIENKLLFHLAARNMKIQFSFCSATKEKCHLVKLQIFETEKQN